MNKIDKFVGQSEEIEINGEKIKIYPLKVKDMALFSKEQMTGEEALRVSREIIKRSLADEKLNDEEIDSMGMLAFKQIMDTINKVNGFSEEDDKLKRIREAQAKIIPK